MERGQIITLNFHAFGIVSHENCKVIGFTEETVTIDDFSRDEEGRTFNRKTGQCLNDSNSFGAYRTIEPC